MTNLQTLQANLGLQAKKDEKLIKESFIWIIEKGMVGSSPGDQYRLNLGSFFPCCAFDKHMSAFRFYSETYAEYGIFFRNFGENELL